MRRVVIGPRPVGDGNPVHFIAEIGGNFTTFDEARRLIDIAVKAGADSVKLQTYQAETITSRKAMYDMPNTGHASQFDLFKRFEIDLPLHREIWCYCREAGIFVFSTPSHMRDVELLEAVGCAVYKIGSDDAWNLPFLRDVAAIGKPMILSTGMCTLEEVRESVSTILGTGNGDLVLLHCVTNYPCQPSDTNLHAIEAMKREFGLPVGFSDHTVGTLCTLGAVALGANMIERHVTYDRNADGPDHMLSLEPAELARLIEDVRTLEAALGDGVKRPAPGERTTRRNNRKSLVATRDVAAGAVIDGDAVAIKRPGVGIAPKYRDSIVGRIARRAISAEDPITWDDV